MAPRWHHECTTSAPWVHQECTTSSYAAASQTLLTTRSPLTNAKETAKTGEHFTWYFFAWFGFTWWCSHFCYKITTQMDAWLEFQIRRLKIRVRAAVAIWECAECGFSMRNRNRTILPCLQHNFIKCRGQLQSLRVGLKPWFLVFQHNLSGIFDFSKKSIENWLDGRIMTNDYL